MLQRETTSKHCAMILALCASLIAATAVAGEPTVTSSPPTPMPPAASTQSAPAALQAQLQAAEQQRTAARRQMQQARRQSELARKQFQAQQREQQQVRRQFQVARRKLEAAAQQVAALSARLAEPAVRQLVHLQLLKGFRQGLIGLQLDMSGGPAGAHVREVTPGGAAEQAGVRAGDLVVAVNGTNVRGHDPASRVVQLMRHVKPGDKVTLRVIRGGQTHEFTMRARDGLSGVLSGPSLLPAPPLPPRAPRFTALAPSSWQGPVLVQGPLSDMELARLSAPLGRYFGTDTGVLVVRAPPHGALGLHDGDVILSIGHRKPTDSSQVIRILSSYDPGEKITMRIMRMHHRMRITTALPTRRGPRRII